MKAPVLRFPFTSSTGDHECRIEFDWLGAERYYVDDQIVLKQWSLVGRTASFSAHGVEIEVRNRFESREAVTQVKIDGTVVFENLLADYNRELRAKLGIGDPRSTGRRSQKEWIFRIILWFLIALSPIVISRWVAGH